MSKPWSRVPGPAVAAVLGLWLLALMTRASAAGASPPPVMLPSAAQVPAAAQGASVSMSAGSVTVTVGQTITLALHLILPRDWADPDPDPSPAFRDVFVTSFPPPMRLVTGDRVTWTWTIGLLAQESGPWVLPAPTFHLHGPLGPITLRPAAVVVSVGQGTSARPLPALRRLWAPPAAQHLQTRSPWSWVLAVTIAILACVALSVGLRRRQPVMTPGLEFQRAWARVQEATDAKEAAARLSLALRRYAGRTWGFDGPGSTVRELSALLRVHLPGEEHRAVMRLLEDLDILRWSGADLDRGQVSPLADDVRAWVTAAEARRQAQAAAVASPDPAAQVRVGTP